MKNITQENVPLKQNNSKNSEILKIETTSQKKYKQRKKLKDTRLELDPWNILL